MFISAQLPFKRNAASLLFVNSHNISIAPDSSIGSFEGENSKSKLQIVLVTTVNNSDEGLPSIRSIKGRQTE